MPHKAALNVFMKPGPRQRVRRALRSGELLDLERQAGALEGKEGGLWDKGEEIFGKVEGQEVVVRVWNIGIYVSEA